MADTTRTPKNQSRAMAFGLGAVLLWSTVATAFKVTLRHTSPGGMLLGASISSAAVLLLVVIVTGRLRTLGRLPRREIWTHLAVGLVNPFAYYLVLFKAYSLLPAQEAQALNYTWAVTFALLAVPILKQRLGPGEVLAILVSYFGVYIISTKGAISSFHVASPTGVGLALGSTLIWSAYWFFNMKSKRDPVLALFLNFLGGAAATGLFLAVRHEGMALTPAALWGSVYIGLFEMGITFVLWVYALRTARKASRIATLIFLSPILSLLFIRFVAKEPIAISTLAGLGFILAGLALQSRFKPPTESEGV